MLDLGWPNERRPVLVFSRTSLIELLHTVAAITATLRGAPTEVEIGVEQGLKNTSCINLCNVFTVRQRQLSSFVGTVDRNQMRDVCRALAVACGCD